MRKKSTRLLSAALAACMMLSVLPVGAFAAEPGTEPENTVSAQAEETLPFAGKEITEGGTYKMPKGTYTGNFVIKTDGDVKIEITGDVTYEYSQGKQYLFDVQKVGTLTVDGGTHKIRVNTTTSDGAILTVGSSRHVIFEGGHYEQDNNDAMFVLGGTGVADLNHVEAVSPSNVVWITKWSKMTVNINGGKYVGIGPWPTLMCSGGTTYINDVEATHSGGYMAVCVMYDEAKVEINNGVYTSNANVVYVSGGTCTINGGTYKATDQYVCVINYGSSAAATVNIHGGVFEGKGTVIGTMYTGTTTIDEIVAKTVIRNIDGGDKNVYKAGVSGSETSTTIIDGCTIENSECGVLVGSGSPSVTLKNAEFNNNTNDICLKANQKITIGDTFTDRATVDVREGTITAPRPITTSSNPVKRNLVSNRADYRVAYDESDGHYYLTPRTAGKFTVDAEDAKTVAEIDGVSTELDANTEIAKDTRVDLTAVAPGAGWELIGWELKVAGEEKTTELLQDADTENPWFTMPEGNVTVRALYNFVGTGDAGGSGSAIGGAIAAGIVTGAAAWGVYEAGTGIYRVINMPGIPMPSNRIELALLVWEHADKPEPQNMTDENLYADIDADDTDAQKAAHWMVEQDLMDEKANNTFKPNTPVTKLRVCTTWEKAKQKGLFDKTEE